MSIRTVFILFFLGCMFMGHAQDTVETIPPVLEDSISPMKAPPAMGWVDYMEEGHYDDIPWMAEIPEVDAADYAKLMQRYQGAEFDYDKNNTNHISLFKRILDRLGDMLNNLFPSRQYFQLTEVVYKLLAVAVLVLFLWIIYRTLFSGKRLLAKDKDDDERSDEVKFVEKNLLDIDLASYIEKAKKEENFALAIRYLNLLNIQLLAKRELIRWKYTKTHVELIEEIENEELKRDFSRNVDIYNRVWYGNMSVDQAKYEEYAPYFLTFQSKWR